MGGPSIEARIRSQAHPVYSPQLGAPAGRGFRRRDVATAAEIAATHNGYVSATARALDEWRAGLSCQLCGAPGPLRTALLRIAWSDARTMVRACPGCAGRAWRTVDATTEAAMVPHYVALPEAPREIAT